MSKAYEEMRLYTKNVDAYSLVPGDILAYDLYLEQGALVLRSGTVLKRQHIEKLKSMGARLVAIDLTKVYQKTIEDSKILMKKVSDGKSIPPKEVMKILKPILKETHREKNMVRLLNQLQSQDDYTFQHTVNIGVISSVIAQWMGYADEKELSEIAIAGTLHDIGKSMIPSKILKKPGALTDVEYEVMKKHPRLGYEIVERMGCYGDEIKQAILQHHEREDGKGYPQGLLGGEIHPYAKIVAVADVYHAMTSKRVYKSKINPFLVLEHLHRNIDRLNPEIILIFVQNMLNCLVGSRVILNNGKRGCVIFVNKQHIGYPLIRLEETQEMFDLNEHKEITIEEILIEQ